MQTRKVGFICGAFDLLHAGHIHLLKQAKKKCDFLIVGLHVDPSIERPEKNKPIESVLERQIKLNGTRYVDLTVVYETEADIELMLQYFKIDVRFLGSDYQKINPINPPRITSENLVPIEYIESLPIHTAEIRERIKRS